MRQRLQSQEGHALYDLRQQTVEPVFGQKKSNQGFARFAVWGLNGAKAESALMFLAHNITKCASKAAHLVRLSSLQPVLPVARIIGSRTWFAGRSNKGFMAAF